MAPAASDLVVGQVLHSSSTDYIILEFIGEGAFGKVAKCLDLNSVELVAVKILKKDFVQDVEDELAMLKVLGQLDADRANVVKFYQRFQHMGYTCLVFEMLDKDLFHYLVEEQNGSMYVDQIRPIAKQLLVALESLQSVGMVHADIKPDNIMLIDEEDLPCQVKLIDFGLALCSSAARPGDPLQPIGYRAPEVSLGLPYNEAIDMWGLGCSLAFLYLGCHLFPVHCEYLMMKVMVEMLGMPPEEQLRCGKSTRNFFCKEEGRFGSRWRLLTPREYAAVNHIQAAEWPQTKCWFTSLDHLPYIDEASEAAEMEDRKAFVDFLKGLLHWDGEKRLSPTAALQHPFITMTHLSQDPGSREYLANAQAFMSITSLEDVGDQLDEARVPEDCEAELECCSSSLKEGIAEETYVPEDWDAELQLCSSSLNVGVNEDNYVPEDWDAELQLCFCTQKDGVVDVYIPENWETELQLCFSTLNIGVVEDNYVAEDWEAELELCFSNQKEEVVDNYVAEDWEAELQLC